jgi:hypothetical protein
VAVLALDRRAQDLRARLKYRADRRWQDGAVAGDDGEGVGVGTARGPESERSVGDRRRSRRNSGGVGDAVSAGRYLIDADGVVHIPGGPFWLKKMWRGRGGRRSRARDSILFATTRRGRADEGRLDRGPYRLAGWPRSLPASWERRPAQCLPRLPCEPAGPIRLSNRAGLANAVRIALKPRPIGSI